MYTKLDRDQKGEELKCISSFIDGIARINLYWVRTLRGMELDRVYVLYRIMYGKQIKRFKELNQSQVLYEIVNVKELLDVYEALLCNYIAYKKHIAYKKQKRASNRSSNVFQVLYEIVKAPID